MLKTVKVGSFYDVPSTIITAMVVDHASIDNLSLRGCREITFDCIESVASRCIVLTSLDIAHCHGIDDEGMASIAQHCPRLLHLDLKGYWNLVESDITDVGVIAIANSCRDLRTLNLRNNVSLTNTVACLRQAANKGK